MVMSNPRAEMPADAKLVPVAEGEEHGYWGQVPDLEDNEVYTAEGAYKAEQQAKKDHAKREAEWAKAASTEDQADDKKAPARRSPAKKDGE
jgi:hypothetical protein